MSAWRPSVLDNAVRQSLTGWQQTALRTGGVLYGTANTSLDHNPSGGAAPALGSAVHHINSTDCGRVHVFLEVGLELIAALPNRDNRRRGDKRRSQWRGRAGIDASR
jgi:hypothetical protein